MVCASSELGVVGPHCPLSFLTHLSYIYYLSSSFYSLDTYPGTPDIRLHLSLHSDLAGGCLIPKISTQKFSGFAKVTTSCTWELNLNRNLAGFKSHTSSKVHASLAG